MNCMVFSELNKRIDLNYYYIENIICYHNENIYVHGDLYEVGKKMTWGGGGW